MKTLSIHNLDVQTAALLRKKAKTAGTSLNKTVQLLLRNALGLETASSQGHSEEFRGLFGVWTAQDAAEFDKAVKPFKTVDKEDWQ